MVEATIIITGWKFLVLGSIHSILGFLLMTLGKHEARATLFLPMNMTSSPLTRVYLSIGIGAIAASLSALAYGYFGLTTMFFITAAFLSLWYIELAILLAHGFFKRLFDEEMPFEITLFISFVVMVNAGYFTLMFLVSVIRSPQFF